VTCKICNQLLTPPDIPLAALRAFSAHIQQHHPEQYRELQAQASSIMAWLTARIFRLDGLVSEAHRDMTERMVRLANGIQAEIEEAEIARIRQVVQAKFEEQDPPNPSPGPPRSRK